MRTMGGRQTAIQFIRLPTPDARGSRFKVGLPPNSHIESFFFLNPERGWLAAVASKEAGRGLIINSVVKNEYGVATDDAVDVYRSASSRILLLTRLGRVVSSSDNGNSWRLDTQFEGENLQTGYEKIESDGGGRLKILAGQAGDEGFRGNLIVEDSEHSLTSYNIARTPLTDAVFLSDSEIIACGMGLQSTQHGDSAQNAQSLAGVVLHSTDGGKTWTIVYRSKSGEPFVSITNINSHCYVIGQAGTLLKFTLDS